MGLMQHMKNARWLLFACAFALVLAGCGGGSSGGSSSSSNGNGDGGLDGGDGPFASDPDPVEGPLDPLQDVLSLLLTDTLAELLRDQDQPGAAEAITCVNDGADFVVDGGDAALVSLLSEDPTLGGTADAVLTDAELIERIAAAYQRFGDSIALLLGAEGVCGDAGPVMTGVDDDLDAQLNALLGEVDALVFQLLTLANDPETTPEAIQEVLDEASVDNLISEVQTALSEAGVDVPLLDDLLVVIGTLDQAVNDLLSITGGDDALALVDEVLELVVDTTGTLIGQILNLDIGEIDGLVDGLLTDLDGLFDENDLGQGLDPGVLTGVIDDLQNEVESLLGDSDLGAVIDELTEELGTLLNGEEPANCDGLLSGVLGSLLGGPGCDLGAILDDLVDALLGDLVDGLLGDLNV